MARKVLTYTVTDKTRDLGKKFVITEMPASKAERWAARALFAMASNGIDVPDNIAKAGMAGLAKYGLNLVGKLPFETAEPLLDEMFTCIVFQPDPAKPEITRALIEDDIEEVMTRVKLRAEVLKLHADFFTNAAK